MGGTLQEDFYSGMDVLAQTFRTLYTGMIGEPQFYGIKDDSDNKGLTNCMDFLFILAQVGNLNNRTYEADGKLLAAALKGAKVTRPERYFI